MLLFDAEKTRAALPWAELIDALHRGFRLGCEIPSRTHQSFEIPNENSGTLLLMPAWIPGEYLGCKQVLVIPENGKRGRSAVNASYQLSNAKSGEPLMLLDGDVLTDRRTAASSALASSFLSRPDSQHLLMVGTGRLAPSLIQAHAAVRTLKKITVWGRNKQKADSLCATMANLGFDCRSTTDLQEAAAKADIISCATASTKPLIYGEWVQPGTHVDLVGGFNQVMRESDDELMNIAEKFVDTEESIHTAGDITQAVEAGVISNSEIIASLYDLCRQEHPGRENQSSITVFKSVGTALEDLFAAIMVYEKTH